MHDWMYQLLLMSLGRNLTVPDTCSRYDIRIVNSSLLTYRCSCLLPYKTFDAESSMYVNGDRLSAFINIPYSKTACSG